jgi:hypothetical protein
MIASPPVNWITLILIKPIRGSGLRKAMTAWPRRLKEAVLFLHFELVDECSEMPRHRTRKGVVLVLEALPDC